jgi:hypothetical protein
VAVGRTVAHGHLLLQSIPYATAPTQAWANVPVLGELAFAGLYGLGGTTALVAAQVVAVGTALAIHVATMRREGATDAGAAISIAVLAVGSAGSLAVVRAQLFSLVLFPLLLGLLMLESRSPSRRAWTLPLLMSVWSMLHGGVLVGAAVAAVWLVLERFQRNRLEATVLLVSLPLAICLTPALARTPTYYRDVLTSEAVQRAYGLWAPLGLNVLDGLLLAAAAGSAALAARERPRPWLTVAAAGLAIMTMRAPRNGIWLLFVLGVPAARAVRVRFAPSSLTPAAGAVVAVVLLATGLARDDSRGMQDARVVQRAAAASRGQVILADPLLAEKVAVAGGRVWIANPIEAFARPAQREWLDWLQERVTIPPSLRMRNVAVAVRTDSDLGRAVAGSARFRRVSTAGGSALYAWVRQP